MKIGYVALAGFAFMIGISAQHTDVEIDHDYEYPTASADWSARQATNALAFSELAGDEDLETILEEFGAPDLEQSFGDVRLMMYRTRRVADDYLTTPDEASVLVFRGSELIGIQTEPTWFGGMQAKVDTDNWQQTQDRNRQAIAQLRFGALKDEVLAELGPADFVDRPLEALEVLAYRTRSVSSDYLTRRDLTRRDETTSLLFEDGIYVGLSHGAPRSH